MNLQCMSWFLRNGLSLWLFCYGTFPWSNRFKSKRTTNARKSVGIKLSILTVLCLRVALCRINLMTFSFGMFIVSAGRCLMFVECCFLCSHLNSSTNSMCAIFYFRLVVSHQFKAAAVIFFNVYIFFFIPSYWILRLLVLLPMPLFPHFATFFLFHLFFFLLVFVLFRVFFLVFFSSYWTIFCSSVHRILWSLVNWLEL